MKYIYLLYIMFYANLIFAMPGEVFLKNGNIVEGDINKLDDGSCWVAVESGSVKFEKDEIERIEVSSKKDEVTIKFLKSFLSTSETKKIDSKYDNLINHAARKYNIDPALVKAVIKVESNFNPFDISHKGACGLMQLMPDTAYSLGVKNIFSPQENIFAGTRYLSNMLYTFQGSLKKALAAYNAGPNVVLRYNNIPPFKETKEYIDKVLYHYKNYKQSGNISSYVDESGCLNIYNEK